MAELVTVVTPWLKPVWRDDLVCFGGDFGVFGKDSFLGGVDGLSDTNVLH